MSRRMGVAEHTLGVAAVTLLSGGRIAYLLFERIRHVALSSGGEAADILGLAHRTRDGPSPAALRIALRERVDETELAPAGLHTRQSVATAAFTQAQADGIRERLRGVARTTRRFADRLPNDFRDGRDRPGPPWSVLSGRADISGQFAFSRQPVFPVLTVHRASSQKQLVGARGDGLRVRRRLGLASGRHGGRIFRSVACRSGPGLRFGHSHRPPV